MAEKRVTAPDITASKGQRKVVMITAYDAGQARLAEQAGADVLLVGDSLGMVLLGYPDTLGVTMSDMLHHVRAVSAGASRAMVLADMPFMSYQVDVAQAVRNAGRLVQNGRAQAVKIEGGREIIPQVKAIVAAGIPVMAHVGLTPQHVARFGGFKTQAKTAEDARQLLDDADAFEQAGCFGLLMECVPTQVAGMVTARLSIPTIGIGAGPECDGQVLVFHDLLGLGGDFRPRFVKRYADLGGMAREALGNFAAEVRSGAFPGPEHAVSMSPEELAALRDGLQDV